MSGSHENEPIRGLPGLLPEGERIVWQGAPHWPSLARNALHLNKIAAYFLLLLIWRLTTLVTDNAPPAQALAGALWPLPLAAIALGLLALFAWLVARTTVYTITNRRVVMRIGVALSMTLNFPFRVIASADLVTFTNGAGNLPLKLGSPDHLAYLVLWPHVRPWRFAKPEPMLRAIPDAARVATLLADALHEFHASNATPLQSAAADTADTADTAAAHHSPLASQPQS